MKRGKRLATFPYSVLEIIIVTCTTMKPFCKTTCPHTLELLEAQEVADIPFTHAPKTHSVDNKLDTEK